MPPANHRPGAAGDAVLAGWRRDWRCGARCGCCWWHWRSWWSTSTR